MRRYTLSSRTRSNVQSTSALQDQFIRELTEQAQAVMAQLSQQFTDDLQNQSAQMLENLVSNNLTADSDDDADDAADGSGGSALGGIGQLLSTGAAYLISRPRTSTSAQETSRSQDANANFKVSTAQSLAEAGVTLSKGNKNL